MSTTPPSSNEPGPDGDPLALPTTATPRKASGRSMVRDIIETLLLALLIFVAVRAVVLNFRVDGHSMDHTLQTGQMLLVNRNAYFSLDQEKWLGWIPGTSFDDGDTWRPFGTPDRGDIVVLHPPADRVPEDKPYIKRVIGVEGDTLQVRDNGVYINDVLLEESYLDAGMVTDCPSGSPEFCGGPIEIPEGFVFVMGDNRTGSSDSRSFGLVPIEDIIGKAWFTYWPAGEIGPLPHADYPDQIPAGANDTRWQNLPE